MPITHVLDRTVTIKRFKTQTGFKKGISSTGTIACTIQPAGVDETEIADVTTGRAFKAWFEETADVNEGDEIVDANGNHYQVKVVRLRDYGTQTHREVLMEGRSVE